MEKEEKREPVRVLRNFDGTAIGIVIETLDEKFGIALNTLDCGKTYTWGKAMNKLKGLNIVTFSARQGRILTVYNKEINNLLEREQGKRLSFEWTSCIYDQYNAYKYVDYDMSINIQCKSVVCRVRPVIPRYIVDKFDK